MGSSTTLRKVIGGKVFFYDRVLDVIYQGHIQSLGAYERKQVKDDVDLCLELTTACNLLCSNCFSNSSPHNVGAHATLADLEVFLQTRIGQAIRVSITGGEPLSHPQISGVLDLPSKYPDTGFVLSTNGTLRSDLDSALVQQQWLVAISLHGCKETHNRYTKSSFFETVRHRIEALARRTTVHIYTVLHDQLSAKDCEWLLHFRDDVGAAYVRFIVPRSFGRWKPLHKPHIVECVKRILDDRSGIKCVPTSSLFRDVNGIVRLSK